MEMIFSSAKIQIQESEKSYFSKIIVQILSVGLESRPFQKRRVSLRYLLQNQIFGACDVKSNDFFILFEYFRLT